jgi:serine/threonine protein kinase
MGEVYKARDIRLDRVVAIKILPDALAADPHFRGRFDREARTISQLDHPHICALYDVGEQDGTAYLVMQYLEGETLAARLAEGALPIDQALQIAIHIADALAAAHKTGVVHRDLKPGNIMLTRAGAKLLDFGLAKTGAAVLGGTNLSMLPTTPPITQQGSILGTFQYMAPEQIDGQDADARTDIFAFGAVVYEMVTGRKAFEGKSQASLLGAIMHAEPAPMAASARLAPPALDRVVRKCLAKEPDARWHSARDLRDELTWIAQPGASTAAEPPVLTRRGALWSGPSLPWVIAALSLIAALGIAAVHVREPASATYSAWFSVPLPPNWATAMFEISPDGRYLAIAASNGAVSQLYLRPIDSLAAQPVPGTDGARYPFWAPDSTSLGFFAQGKLKKIALTGGSPVVLCDAPDPHGASWNQKGVILFAAAARGALQRVSAAGGIPTAVTTLTKTGDSHRYPQFLPDGRRFLFLSNAEKPDTTGIYVGSLDGTPAVRLLPDASSAAYVADRAGHGHVLFKRDATLMALPFDPDRLRPIGELFPIAEGISESNNSFHGSFSGSNTGMLAFQPGTAVLTLGGELTWVDRRGKALGVLAAPGAIQDFSLSPDDKRVAATVIGDRGITDIWLGGVDGGLMSRVTFGSTVSSAMPVWSPDGKRIAFTSRERAAPHYELYQRAASGAGSPDLISSSTAANVYASDWSPDGSFLVYGQDLERTKRDIWLLPLIRGHGPAPYLQTPVYESGGKVSPDGRWMAYASDESGRREVYVQAIPAGAEKWQVSVAGGTTPQWRRDGEELYFVSADQKMMAVAVKNGLSFALGGGPQALFEAIGLVRVTGSDTTMYQPAADGQRFLLLQSSQSRVLQPITVVLNWTAARKQ